MIRKNDKTIWGVIGVLLNVFGIIGMISILINKKYHIGLIVTAISVIIGVILVAWSFND